MSAGFGKVMRKLGSVLTQRDEEQHRLKLDGPILVGTHHKTGTAWMSSIFRGVCDKFSLSFYSGSQDGLPDEFDVFFQNHSKFDRSGLPADCRGLHIIRDPRDLIVSGTFYHQKSAEEWLHIPRDKFGGLTYQQKINSYQSFDDQLAFEMENTGTRGIGEILAWRYDDPSFFEAKYEDLIVDEDLRLFHEIFLFLRFPGAVIPEVLRICYDNSLFSGGMKRSIHIRSGRPRQWEKYFNPSTKKMFVELFGDALIELGYESDNDWATR